MLNWQNAKKIEFKDFSNLAPYLQNLNTPSCEMSFANLKMWGEVYDTKLLKYGDEYLFFAPNDNLIYFPRWQNLSTQILVSIAEEFKEFYHLDKVIYYDVDNDFVEQNNNIRDFFEVEIDENDFDYLYQNQVLSTMSGSILKKKRNLINQFTQNYPNYFIENLDNSNAEKGNHFAHELNNLLTQTEFIDEENQSMDYAFRNFEMLGLQGFILYAEVDLPVGFTVFSKLNNDFADIHYEKARHDIKGAPQILVQLLAKRLTELNFSYMNREQDLGNEGIRQAKKSLAPCGMYQRVKLKQL